MTRHLWSQRSCIEPIACDTATRGPPLFVQCEMESRGFSITRIPPLGGRDLTPATCRQDSVIAIKPFIGFVSSLLEIFPLVTSRCSVTPLPGLLGKNRTLLLRRALSPHDKINFSAVTIFPYNHRCASSPDCDNPPH